MLTDVLLNKMKYRRVRLAWLRHWIFSLPLKLKHKNWKL